ncbi:MAG: AAA family ATPase [Deferribacteraceae bacterium]|jgi:DNA replication and repair protein RecF|nr:AAA family ATPase [Deferribacteraceae bacterium]
MLVQTVLKNFRCHKDLTIEFSKNPFYISGNNGTGKTSVIEAIFTLLTLKSFRRINIKDAVSYGEEFLRISALFDDKPQLEMVFFYESQRRLLINGSEAASTDFSHIFPTVCYSPGFETLFSIDQQVRRVSLDRIVYYTNKLYVEDVRNYNALLIRKRAELAAEKPDHGVLAALNVQLTPLSEKISRTRNALVDEINQEIISDPLYDELLGGVVLALEINPMIKNSRELPAKRPLCGCHKDLLYLKKDGVVVEKFQSFGQKKSALLFILYQISKIIEKKRNQSIILLLDDFEAGLDGNRVKLIEGLFLNGNNGLSRQVVLTGISASARSALVL